MSEALTKDSIEYTLRSNWLFGTRVYVRTTKYCSSIGLSMSKDSWIWCQWRKANWHDHNIALTKLQELNI